MLSSSSLFVAGYPAAVVSHAAPAVTQIISHSKVRLLKDDSYESLLKDLLTYARENPDSGFAGGLAQNPNFKPEAEDIKIARENPESLFTYGLAQNLNLFNLN